MPSTPITTASEEFLGMRKNLAQTHGPGNMIESDTAGKKPSISMDRRVSVAPMMDWTD
jgi:hypothetical protein